MKRLFPPFVFFALIYSSSLCDSQMNVPEDNKGIPKNASQETATYEIPFEYEPESSHFLIVKMRLGGGNPQRFILDTGTSVPVILRRTRSAKMKLKLTGKKVSLKGTRVQGDEVKGLRVELVGRDEQTQESKGLLPTIDQTVVSEDEFPIQQADCEGIIGINYFYGKVLTFDFVRKVLTVAPGTLPLSFFPDSVLLPLDYKNNLIFTKLTSSKGEPVEFMIDTGADLSVLNVREVPKFQFEQTPKIERFSYISGKSKLETLGLLSDLSVGSFKEAGLIVSLSRRTDIPNLLGMQFLSRFRVTLFVARKTMVLDHASNYVQASRMSGASSVVIVQGKKLVVVDVLPNSQAQKAGVLPGDILKKVDGVPAEKLPTFLLQGRLDGIAETEAQIEVERGGRLIALKYRRESLFSLSDTQKIGIGISADSTVNETLKIIGVTDHSPASDAGLTSGDEIVAVNGKKIADTPFKEIVDELKKPVGSSIVLRVRKMGMTIIQEFILKVRHLP